MNQPPQELQLEGEHRMMHLCLARHGGRCPRQIADTFAEKRRVNKVHILDKHHIDSYCRETMATRELLNVRDTARALGVHENTVRNWEAPRHSPRSTPPRERVPALRHSGRRAPPR
jgi:hypothetical protein